MQIDKTDITSSQILFGLTIVVFVTLVVVEKLNPYRHFTDNIDKALSPTQQHFCLTT